MSTVEDQIQEVVDRETRAWDTQDVELLAEGPGGFHAAFANTRSIVMGNWKARGCP